MSDQADKDLGAKRLMTRLKAFRDEHIKIETVPMLFGIADTLPDMKEAGFRKNSIVEKMGDNMVRIISLFGTIFTKYDQKMATELGEINQYEDLMEQSKIVLERMKEVQVIIERKMSAFKPMSQIIITEKHKVRKLQL